MSLGLADGGEANLAAVLQASDAVDPTGAALLEACRLDDAGAWAGALARYRDVMQAWPDDPLVRLRAAEASCSLLLTHGLDLWSAGDCPAAEAAIRQALAASPDRADARETLAKLLTTLGRHREALAEIESALAVDPGDPDLLTGRRAILHNLARTAR